MVPWRTMHHPLQMMWRMFCDGDLCRCTGYRPIIDCAKTFARDIEDCYTSCTNEPPFFLSAAVFFAIKDALYAARKENSYFQLDSPATVERIRLSVMDDINRMVDKVCL
jgi:xanthine dehydrogenase iron-sulfur cluster and FAD-binding subunit A